MYLYRAFFWNVSGTKEKIFIPAYTAEAKEFVSFIAVKRKTLPSKWNEYEVYRIRRVEILLRIYVLQPFICD